MAVSPKADRLYFNHFIMPKTKDLQIYPSSVIQAGLFCSGAVDDFEDRKIIARSIDITLLEYLKEHNVAIACVNGMLEFVKIEFDNSARIWK